MACVIAKDGTNLDEETLREYILGRLARHKVPRYIELMDEFPMNAAGKVLKYKMREYLRTLCDDKDFVTTVLPIGDGMTLSVRK